MLKSIGCSWQQPIKLLDRYRSQLEIEVGHCKNNKLLAFPVPKSLANLI